MLPLPILSLALPLAVCWFKRAKWCEDENENCKVENRGWRHAEDSTNKGSEYYFI